MPSSIPVIHMSLHQEGSFKNVDLDDYGYYGSTARDAPSEPKLGTKESLDRSASSQVTGLTESSLRADITGKFDGKLMNRCFRGVGVSCLSLFARTHFR